MTSSVHKRPCFTYNTTPDLQDQYRDHSVQDQDQDRFFWSQTGIVLRPMVSDHITGPKLYSPTLQVIVYLIVDLTTPT